MFVLSRPLATLRALTVKQVDAIYERGRAVELLLFRRISSWRPPPGIDECNSLDSENPMADSPNFGAIPFARLKCAVR